MSLGADIDVEVDVDVDINVDAGADVDVDANADVDLSVEARSAGAIENADLDLVQARASAAGGWQGPQVGLARCLSEQHLHNHVAVMTSEPCFLLLTFPTLLHCWDACFALERLRSAAVSYCTHA